MRLPRPARFLLLLAGLAAVPGARPAAAADPAAFRIAFLGPLAGPLAKASEESLLGVRAAAEVAGATRPVDVVPFDDGDDPKKADAALLRIQKEKFHAVVAAASSVTVEAISERARKGRIPVLLCGSVGHRPTIDPEDRVMSVSGWPVDQALSMANVLGLRAQKSGLGLYRGCLNPGIVAEASPAWKEMADALARNIGGRLKVAGRAEVAPRGTPAKEDLVRLRDAKCDRLVLLGEPDLLDRTAEALAGIGWDVPVFCADGMLSAAAESIAAGKVKRGNWMQGIPALALPKEWMPQDGSRRRTPSDDLRRVLDNRGQAGKPTYPRVRAGWFASWLVLKAAAAPRRPDGPRDLGGAIREVAYTRDEERERPVLDETGRAALIHWFTWTVGEKGPEPIKPSYLPTPDLGPLLRTKRAADFDAVPLDEDTKIVWLTFGEKEPKNRGEPARTIEQDLAFLGLNTSNYEAEMDPWILEDLQVRTLWKINRLFLKNHDGTFVPGVSWNIHFTFTKPEKLKPSKYWTGIIAGEMSWDREKDEPTAGDPGGVCHGNVVYIFSRWMRYHTAIKDKRLSPRMSREDRPYLDGTYEWGTTYEQNLRGDGIRALIDGYASFFSMTGAHEFGHSFGCGHDTESSRSIMNVVDAVGLRDTQAHWIPMHVKALDTALGRKK